MNILHTSLLGRKVTWMRIDTTTATPKRVTSSGEIVNVYMFDNKPKYTILDADGNLQEMVPVQFAVFI